MSFLNPLAYTEPAIDQVWNELRAGDKSALERIYTTHIKDLFSFGMSLHADETIVKDAIQDVFIDLWNYRFTLSSDVIIKQYLFKSLSNRIQKELGKNIKRTSLHWLIDQENTVASVEDELVKTQGEKEISQKMVRAMKLLPLRQKEVIQYLFFEKLSYEDTAKMLDITIRSTYTLAWKAISALKKAIIVLTVYFSVL